MAFSIVKNALDAADAWGGILNTSLDKLASAISTIYNGGSGVGTAGQILKRNSSSDGDYFWSDNLHAASHGPGMPDATFMDRGDMNSTSFCPIARDAFPSSIALTSGRLYTSFGTCYSSFTASQLLAAAGTPTGSSWPITLAQMVVYVMDASDNATQVAISGNLSSTAFTVANQVMQFPLATNFNFVRGTRYGLGLLVVGSGTTAPTLRMMNGNNTFMDTRFGQIKSRNLDAQSSVPSSISVGSWTSSLSQTTTLQTACLAASI